MKNKKVIHMIQDNMILVIGILIVLVFVFFALFPNLVTGYDPDAINARDMLQAPSASHWFGTDNYGRDLYTRVIYATRIDLLIGIGAMIVPFIAGTTLGLIAGYYGGKLDSIIMRIVDVFMAFPYMVLAIAIVAITGAGISALFISMWLVGWKEYTRLVRSEVIVVKQQEYIQAAKVLGYGDGRIIIRNVLPNVLSSAIVYAASDIVMCMLSGAALSYLGLGVQIPLSEWGAIISDGKTYLSQAWWITFFPGLFLMIAGLGFSLIGDGLSDLLRTKH
ncbi:MAG: ABC transporter permease [Eubacteriales bacterium]